MPASVIVLAADTSTPLGSVALLDGPELLAEARLRLGRGHAEGLLPAVDALLRLAGLTLPRVELFCSGLGPGGFTGLRIGVVTMRILSYAMGQPVAGVSSLDALCAPWLDAEAVLVATLDAHKGEVYAGAFRASSGRLQRIGPEAVIPPDRLAEQLRQLAEAEDVLVFGSGAERYAKELRGLSKRVLMVPGMAPLAAGAARCALRMHPEGTDRAAFVPNYVRKSDAELNWARKPGP